MMAGWLGWQLNPATPEKTPATPAKTPAEMYHLGQHLRERVVCFKFLVTTSTTEYTSVGYMSIPQMSRFDMAVCRSTKYETFIRDVATNIESVATEGSWIITSGMGRKLCLTVVASGDHRISAYGYDANSNIEYCASFFQLYGTFEMEKCSHMLSIDVPMYDLGDFDGPIAN
jgi:hypothetical protein